MVTHNTAVGNPWLFVCEWSNDGFSKRRTAFHIRFQNIYAKNYLKWDKIHGEGIISMSKMASDYLERMSREV